VRTSLIETSTVRIRVPASHTNFTKQFFLCCLDFSSSIDDGVLVHLNVFRLKFRGFISLAVAVSLALVSHCHFQVRNGDRWLRDHLQADTCRRTVRQAPQH
jgi:hypothetical protein